MRLVLHCLRSLTVRPSGLYEKWGTARPGCHPLKREERELGPSTSSVGNLLNPPLGYEAGLEKNGKHCLITNSSFVLFLLCFLCSEYTVRVFLLLPAGTRSNYLLYGGVLSLGWMCGWFHTRGTRGGLFFPRPTGEVFDGHTLGSTGARICLCSDTYL
ncbi:hypothetical protein B9Z19DRAFT_1076025 [Tuber borchii]|uniref:Uncharacterized protein n=1 Tax=Tuber borchii TaxID=42251 RepID=A0A2T7A2F5_TUBBO|nr:hypothetical protein B9Z19DRAFT_1076025 [Tuber borchii]